MIKQMIKRDKAMGYMYPNEGDFRCIALKLNEPRQLYSLLDPAPFQERELDANAALYLLDAARELTEEQHVKIVLHFPVMPGDSTKQDLVRAIHHYFHYRAAKLVQQRRHLLRIGRRALAVGLLFMCACSILAWSLEDSANIWLKLGKEGIVILGWVAMWKPIDIFLYEWWPLYQDQKLCRRLQHMAVDIRERVGHK